MESEEVVAPTRHGDESVGRDAWGMTRDSGHLRNCPVPTGNHVRAGYEPLGAVLLLFVVFIQLGSTVDTSLPINRSPSHGRRTSQACTDGLVIISPLCVL